MTDKESLFTYRLEQAEETLNDVKRMLVDKYSTRSMINRSYYVTFYSLLALFIKSDVNITTSKHSGIISTFDKEFVQKNTFDRHYSKIIHILFDLRQESDYKELVEISIDEASDSVKSASEFFNAIKDHITGKV